MNSTSAAIEVDLDERSRWAAAGLDQLTGPPEGPVLGPPEGLVARLDALTARLGESAAALHSTLAVDGLSVLSVRAGLLGLRRRGQVSCGGSCHLVQAADGWFAVSLARPDDWELLPAWLGTDGVAPGSWDDVHRVSRRRPVAETVECGALLGLPIGALGERAQPPASHLLGATATAPRTGSPRLDALRVADLSSMWAGPLCGSILAEAGAEVLKVESLQRPDGTRRGSLAFHELLNGAKEPVVVDLGTPRGIDELRALLRSVDVVIESTRPRALQQLGIDAAQLLDDPDGPELWVSITGHGRDEANAHRVAFGDDAAVSGGLVSWWQGEPQFCADAVADPLTGLWAADAALGALVQGHRGMLEVVMSDVAAYFAAGTPVAARGPER